MSFAAIELKNIYVKRTPESVKTLHIVSSAFKATFTWHNIRSLQVGICILLLALDIQMVEDIDIVFLISVKGMS